MQKNIFSKVGEKLVDEAIETLLQTDAIKLERIISKGHASPKDFWYDQDQNEWVCLLQGSAILEFKEDKKIHLKTGDYLTIFAHEKHRIHWIDPTCETIWLALFY